MSCPRQVYRHSRAHLFLTLPTVKAMRRSFLPALSTLALGLAACSQTAIPTTSAPELDAQSLSVAPRSTTGALVKHFTFDGGVNFTGMQVEPLLTVHPRPGTRFDIWNAVLTPPAPGTYTFTVTTTAKVELLIDGVPVLSQTEREDGRSTQTTGTVTLDGPAELTLKYAHTTRSPNLLLVTWGQNNRIQGPILSKFLSPRDLTADCEIQPLTNCRARFRIPYSMGIGIIGTGRAVLQHPVENLSEVYPLDVRFDAPVPLGGNSMTLMPLESATVNYEVSCPNTYGWPAEIKTIRMPDGQTQTTPLSVLCGEIVAPPVLIGTP